MYTRRTVKSSTWRVLRLSIRISPQCAPAHRTVNCNICSRDARAHTFICTYIFMQQAHHARLRLFSYLHARTTLSHRPVRSLALVVVSGSRMSLSANTLHYFCCWSVGRSLPLLVLLPHCCWCQKVRVCGHAAGACECHKAR